MSSPPPPRTERPRRKSNLLPPPDKSQDQLQTAQSMPSSWNGCFLYRDCKEVGDLIHYTEIQLEEEMDFTVREGRKVGCLASFPTGTRFGRCQYNPKKLKFEFFYEGDEKTSYMVGKCPCCDSMLRASRR
jgi:hypothetical protein